MRRAHDDDLCPWRDITIREVQTIFVNFTPCHVQSRSGKDGRKGPVARVLDDRSIAYIRKQSRTEVNCLVCTGSDNDLARIAIY